MGAHEITKSSLANKLQISRESLTNKLGGITPWTVAELEKLAEIFNKRRNYFFQQVCGQFANLGGMDMNQEDISKLNPQQAKSWNNFLEYLATLISNKLSNNKEDKNNGSETNNHSK